MSVDVKIFNICDHYTGGKQYTMERCPRCHSKGYYYDIAFDGSGKAITTSGTLKLQQEVLKAMNDIKGDNLFFPRWGSDIHDYIGRKSTVTSRMKMDFSVRRTLEYLQNLQGAENDTYDNMTSDEIILGIQAVNIREVMFGYDVRVTFSNRSEEITSTAIEL